MKVMLHYQLLGAVAIDVPDEKMETAFEYLLDQVLDGVITDEELIGHIESSDAYGIDGDAINLVAISDPETGETIKEF